jgi:Ser/Thr protein kinase RdoA (MazF antagonist)
MSSDNQHPFATLSPERVIDAVESSGRLSDLRVFPLNSYENRVYQVGIDGAEPLIAKFYRPERWSDAQILEEHQFSLQLAEAELPVIAPLRNDQGETLLRFEGFRFALFPRRGGSAPELSDPDTLLMLGRLLARLHAIGELTPFRERPALDVRSFGYDSVELVLARCIPADSRPPTNPSAAICCRASNSALPTSSRRCCAPTATAIWATSSAGTASGSSSTWTTAA